MEKVTEVLLEALRHGASAQGVQRLFRSGKLPGLFSGRTSLNTEIASQAVRDGLIELVRTETKGKTTTEWVQVTQQGTAFLLEHESPVRAMEELKTVLQAHRDGLPHWLAELRRTLEELAQKINTEVSAIGRRLDSLAEQVEDSIKRADKLGPQLPEARRRRSPGLTMPSVTWSSARRAASVKSARSPSFSPPSRKRKRTLRSRIFMSACAGCMIAVWCAFCPSKDRTARRSRNLPFSMERPCITSLLADVTR